jgi:hypothetical protein
MNTIQPERTYLYIEKDNEFFLVYGTSVGENKKGMKRKFMKLLEDDPVALKKVKSAGYSHKVDDIVSVVRDYNHRNYVTKSVTDESMIGKIIFYRSSKKQGDKPVRVKVDNQEYILDSNSKFSLNLPVTHEVKICVESKSGKFCDLVLGSPYFYKYYEIDVCKKGNIKFKKSSKDDMIVQVSNL